MMLECSDALPNLLGMVDTSIAPPLLYYSYLPIVIVSLILGFFVYYKDKRSLASSLLLALSIYFSLHIVNEIIQWIAVDAAVVHFAWQMSALLQLLVVLTAARFSYVFISKSDIRFIEVLAGGLILTVAAVLTPTTLNMSSFDITYCEGLNGSSWLYIYAAQIAVFVWVIVRFYFLHKKSITQKTSRAALLGVATLLGLFIGSNIFGDITSIYNINLIGPLGMAVFLVTLSYLVVRYRQFAIQVLSTQALVAGLWVLVFGILFIRRIENVRIVTVATLVLVSIAGWALIKSVKREIEQREKIETLAKDLSLANDRLKLLDQQKSEFVSIASHQLRSPLTAMKGYSSMLLEGSFGKLGDKAKDAVDRIFQSSQRLVIIIEDFLNLSRIEQGRMQYEFNTVELRSLVEGVVKEQEAPIKDKGLSLTFENDGGTYDITADSGKVRQVVTNIIDNAVKYTPSGGITLTISKDSALHKVILKIQDTGIGIPKEVMPKLFLKFSRAEDAGKTNIMGTGLGLFVAREIMKAHHGDVRVESEGTGKGSTFYLEFMGE